ncbi:MAG: hypothetical protein DMG93_22215 [Acidobacteria bacterium]|nr:MAG: hypothetical protein DMG93_22215 [Acidobacteriota bacterium]
MRVEDLVASEASDQQLNEEQLQASANELTKALRSAAQRSNAPYVICICPPSSGVSNRPDSLGICERVQSSLSSQLTGIKGVSLVAASELLQLYPVEKYTDEYAWRVGHIPYTTPFFNALATMIARRICVLRSAPYQVIVADCDQTLWNSAQLASKKVGEPYRAVQEFLIAQQQSGKILCLVGTNSKESVESALASGMPLESQHIADMRIDDRHSCTASFRPRAGSTLPVALLGLRFWLSVCGENTINVQKSLHRYCYAALHSGGDHALNRIHRDTAHIGTDAI